jgi:hypothetical protein
VLAALSVSAVWVVNDVQGAGARVAVPPAPVTASSTTSTTTVVPVPDPPPPAALTDPFAAAGYELPEGTSVYAARVESVGGVLQYTDVEAGGGASASDFWPASSIKVLAAVGALEYLRILGFTGAATVTSADGWSSSLRDLYVEAIRDSSNEAYDRLVQIAGLEWLNDEFLTSENGFPVTVVQRSYSGEGVQSAAMTLDEGDRTLDLTERISDADFGVPDDGNRSDLSEMVDSVRRVVLDRELPASDRLGLAQDDLDALTRALLESEGFVEPGVASALGDDALVYNKPGWVSGEACVDVALVVDPSSGSRYLLGVVSPDDGGACTALADIAAIVLPAL